MAEVFGTIGGDFVELNNAATETSLRELIRVIQNQTKSLASNVGGGGSASAAAVNAANTGLDNLAKTTKETNSSAVTFGASLRKASDELSKFAAKLIQGTASASDLFDSFSRLPGILGVVANGMKMVAKFQEENFATYQNITRAGVNFGGSLTEMRVAMQGARLTSEEFGRIIKANSENFTRMGTDVNSGARAFFAFTSSLQESEVGKDLRSLGITSDELNEGFATYIAATGGRTRQEMMDRETLTKSAKAYFEQLDALSTLTGISREELEKEQKERAANAAMQNYLQSLEPAEREKANRALQEAMARGGKGAEQALLSRLMGIPPLTPAAQQFETVTREASQNLGAVVDSVKDSSKSLDDVSAASAGITTGLAKDARDNQQLFRVLSLQQGEFAQTTNKALAAANQTQIQGVRTIQDEQARRAEVERVQRQRQLESEAEQMAASKKALEELGLKILNALVPAITVLTQVIKFVTEIFRDVLSPVIDLVAVNLEWLWSKTGPLREIFVSLYNLVKGPLIISFQSLDERLARIRNMFDGVSTQLKEKFGPSIDALKTKFNELDEKLGGGLSTTLGLLIAAITGYTLIINRQKIVDAAKTVKEKIPGMGKKPGTDVSTALFVRIVGPIPLPVTMSGTTVIRQPGTDAASPLFVRIVAPIPLPVTMSGGLPGRRRRGRRNRPGGGGGGPPPRPPVPPGGGGGPPPRPPVPPGGGGGPPPGPPVPPGGGGGGGGGGRPTPRQLPGRFGSFLGSLKSIPGAAAIVGALDIASIMYQSGEMEEEEFYNEISRAIGSAVGGLGGAALGAKIGTLVGGPLGALAGGAGGYLLGTYGGEWIARKIVDWMRGEKNQAGASGVVQGGAAFAEGGYVTKPTFGLVGEGGEPEIIAPESKMREIIDEAVAKRSVTGENGTDPAIISSLESMNSTMKALNTLMTDLLKYSKEISEYTRRTEEATKNLNGNLFA